MANKKKIRGVLIDVYKNEIKPYTLEHSDLNNLYVVLKCSTVANVQRSFGGVMLDVWCDEEALLKPNQKVAIVTQRDNNKICEMLYGNCFLCLRTKNGDMKSIPYGKMDTILKSKCWLLKYNTQVMCAKLPNF